MKNILLLTDYKGFFGSKQKSKIYNGGFDLEKLRSLFENSGFAFNIARFTDIDFRNTNFNNTYVLYTSSEDRDLFYKDFIEDILLGLKLKGAILIPEFELFRAHDNKVFMEILRDINPLEDIKTVSSNYFGTLEDVYQKKGLRFPLVFKKASGSKSRGVGLVKSVEQLIESCKKISKSLNLRDHFWEKGRVWKYKTYVPNSSNRKKFITQNLIEGLSNDWKVLVYGNKYYVLKRYNRQNDFRASGGGLLEYTTELPEGLLDFSRKIYNAFSTPHLSIDVAFDGKTFHLIEMQFIYFGTYTLEYSNFYFLNKGNAWELIKQRSDLEEVYCESIVGFINSA